MATPFLKIDSVSKVYLQGKKLKRALCDVSLEIFEGEVVSLLGVNGAGKTTLSSIIATLTPPTAGSLLWHGRSVYKHLMEYRYHMGFCPQNPGREKNLSVAEQLLFAAKCYGLKTPTAQKRRDELLETFGLNDYRDATLNTLSGGYVQRFSLAKALVHRPRFVILDEPTVGLDSHVRRQIWELLKQLRQQGIAILLTTHYLDEAEVLSDRVCLIHGGRIRTIDTPQALKHKHKKNSLEEVFLSFVEDPQMVVFSSGTEPTSPSI